MCALTCEETRSISICEMSEGADYVIGRSSVHVSCIRVRRAGLEGPVNAGGDELQVDF